MKLMLASAVAVLAVALLSACGGDSTDDLEPEVVDGVSVDLGGTLGTAYGLTIDPNPAQAGDTTLVITNRGRLAHNFLIVRTDLPEGALPLDSDSVHVDEPSVDVVFKSRDLEPGEVESVSVFLEPGRYLGLCNIEDHYQEGMVTTVEVR